jgi:hypothetical protein
MGETAETLRNYHHASKKPGEPSHLDPESYLKLSPNDDGETEAIETALYALQALEKGLGSNTKDRRHAPRAS